MILKELRRRALDVSPFCAGIDLRMDQVPQEIQEAYEDRGDRLYAYAKEAVDAANDYASCFKVQIACYEAEGLSGLKAYSQILKYIREKGHLVIADVKRGDIGSTAGEYAKGHFTGDFEADILTLNPYMGKDAISPYFDYFTQQNKGAFILAKTSNAGSLDFQDLELKDSLNSELLGNILGWEANYIDQENAHPKLYSKVLKKIHLWNKELTHEDLDYPMGAVVGVNEAKNIKDMKKLTDMLFLLVPGYGAQGAKLEDIKQLIGERKNGVVNVSRGYTAKAEGDYRAVLKERAHQLAKELRTCFE